MSDTTTKPKRVAIVGSGVTGLLMAQGLQKNGFQVTVYERDRSLEYRDKRPISFAIHWGFENLQDILPQELWAKIHTTFCNPASGTDRESPGLTFFHGTTGQLLFQTPPMVYRRVTRQKLRRLISTNIDIRWNMTLSAADVKDGTDGNVTLSFIDGSSATADVLVGADGPKSKVREILLGSEVAEVTKSEFTCGFSSAVLGSERAKKAMDAHPHWTMAYHPMGVCATGVEDAVDPDDMSTWVFNVTRIWRGDSERFDGPAAIQVIRDNSKTFCEPFKSIVEGIPEDSPCFVRPINYWRPVPWPNFDGRITLGGDAAHPMLPFRAQGLNHAMEDAFRLVRALKETYAGQRSLKESIDEYDAEVVKRGAQAVDTAVNEGAIVQDMDKVSQMIITKQALSKDKQSS